MDSRGQPKRQKKMKLDTVFVCLCGFLWSGVQVPKGSEEWTTVETIFWAEPKEGSEASRIRDVAGFVWFCRSVLNSQSVSPF